MNLQITKTQTYFKPDHLEDEMSGRVKAIHQNFSEKITDSDFPCVGAKAAINSRQYRLGIYEEMGAEATTLALAEDLKTYIAETIAAESEYMSMVAVFTDEVNSELDFENRIWTQLQKLHDIEKKKQIWDPEVSSNPEESNFSFSFNGTAFFVVGLHPKASRRARRFGYTAMAFNLHRQFEQLREKGVYENMKKVIRDRELSYDGSINPMLKDHGEGLEAPQYSGRKVDKDWKCPFHAN
ncbi:guanitoxin biosynthesis heme-dependent pre-guanitoxin N-hydroxylase GntA [Catalinimonas niigatensis]|uniref:guanitoxin biosynthesis heme-dependent pre-guanitoxin N-hydroxylase GntA n=1 Tax=Catalinimonas niigatensis TaxID=1397264 RepID=UPI0026661E7E|nr:guanitoxin biosynthesis heme-dependent pre-guanitoxin N-hydroxylase GntA [Catalinimonas niigatensis]WPP50762.1 guanitoxin biosynthesis heme-dependent pre-guanitoxin N-hydroxylase GntA [Catalinimonas niigatensis]